MKTTTNAIAPRTGGDTGHLATRALTVLVIGMALSCGMRTATAEIVARPEVVVAGPDPGVAFELLGGVAVDGRHGEIAVAETGRGRVLFFDRAGFLLGQFIHTVREPGGRKIAGRPTSLAFDREGNLLVVDQAVPYVDVLDYLGNPIARLDLPAPDDDLAAAGGAAAVAVAADGTILVAGRSDSARVYLFTPEFELAGRWSGRGREHGNLNGITGIAAGPNGDIVITCARTDLAVQVFDRKGAFKRGFGVHDIGPGNFSLPAGVAVAADGRIWVVDEIRQVVQVFEASGTFVQMMGGRGRDPGSFEYPCALAIDGSQVVVAERVGGRFQVWGIQ